jgi:hypothetical protein
MNLKRHVYAFFSFCFPFIYKSVFRAMEYRSMQNKAEALNLTTETMSVLEWEKVQGTVLPHAFAEVQYPSSRFHK